MKTSSTRRYFLTASAGAIGGAAILPGLPPVTAQEATLKPGVTFDPRVESLVRLIENSPREKLLERVANKIRSGSSYQQVLAALMLAGIRNVQPRPAVGFKFHCVLVVNSCHLASQAGPDEDRWLPIFWGLDYFKSSQADESRRSGWTMQPVNEALVPDAARAHSLFAEAMDAWDAEKADVATAGLVRHAGATGVFNAVVRYAARDYRSIGHKAIYLANAWRTLQVIGWQHAEPVMRSLVFALLNHEGEPNPAASDLAADRPWRENSGKSKTLPASWLDGEPDEAATRNLIETFRSQTAVDASQCALEALICGVSPQSIWDGVFVGAGELLMQQPGIIGLHGLTTANAIHFLWQTAQDDSIRRQLLLQACSFNPMFRQSAAGRGKLQSRTIESFQESSYSENPPSPHDILSEISSDRNRAAEQVHAYLSAGGDADDLVSQARRVLFAKGRDAHDYKFTSAVLEDYRHISPAWRNLFLSTSVFNLKGTGHADNSLVARARAALA